MITCQWCVVFFVLFFWVSQSAVAAPVGANDAANAVQGWLRQDHRPLGWNLPSKIKRTETVKDAAGNALYYAVHLAPAGYVIVSGDDTVEPFIAFSARGDFDSSAHQGIAAWINRDLPARMARAGAAGERERKAHRKWRSALATSPNPPPDFETNDYIVLASQVWVAPFIQTLWNQQTDLSGDYACYNFYVPPYGAGNMNNYPCGCVATAMAQVMYYFQYPTEGVGTAAFDFQIYNTNTSASLRGGDGNGGPYQWTNMPLSPNNPISTQAQAIGALCFDAALTVHMQFESGGSGASDSYVNGALENTFQYAYAAYGSANNGLAGASLQAMLNPNLDARLPVILGIEPAGGHEVLCDGYSYSGSTLFHHLNMGWAGDDDVWYALPNIDATDNNDDFTMVSACVYNIYTNGTGLIISGRVTDPTGAPVPGASVTAWDFTDGDVFAATTESNGIYAVTGLPSDNYIGLTVTNLGDIPVASAYITGQTKNGTTTTGNVWGANFVISPPLLAMPESGFASIGPVGGPFNVTSQAYTLTNSTAAAVNWAASSPAAWLNVTPGNGAVAAGAVSTFSISLSAAAASLAAGSNAATIWITNLTTGLAQSLQFSLAVESADYPIAITGYSDDVVVENTATGGNSLLYADTFDSNNADFSSPASFCFYQKGLVAVNFGSNDVPAVEGLPQSGFFTSAADEVTTFQLGPYAGYNILALGSGTPSGTLTLSSPLAYKSLSVLAATAEGGGTGALVLNFSDGTSSSAISFNATNYYTTNSPGSGAAISRFGVLETGNWNEYYVFEHTKLFPTLYQTSVNLESLGLHAKPINSITFTMPGGLATNAVTGVFALSGTQSPYPIITSQPQSLSIGVGGDAALSIGVSGGAPLSYHWLLNGALLAGGQSSQLNITNAGAANAGNYQVVVTNSSGAVTSAVAALSITNLPVTFVTGGNALQYSRGRFILQLTNLAGQGPIVISASTNLTQWVPIFTNPSGFGSFTFTDSVANTLPHRFYRATTP
ncbi:MAG: C10 family peptidase [Verrucomicrobiota bacterium]